ncbi:fibronectin type III domain-containing protein 7-like [Neoarius graeffei]|uniref:fibronectin type III domain-containing protein 7-like n=1 Tax=Neoarius graeffei TaxID=443677 RepID=UPI00298C015D|nr:fibronectin type III domain-containing protein 7-like [Neoarius graeffei]
MGFSGVMLWMLLLGIAAQNVVQGDDLTISVYTVTSKSAVLTWSKYVGSSSYRLTASPRNSPDPSVFSSFSQNTVMGSISTLSPNTNYIFKVEALDSSMSVLAQNSVNGCTASDVPIITAASSKQSQSITVEFTQVSGASSYILRTETSNGSFMSETSVPGSPGTVSSLQPYTDYTLSVMSVNSCGRSQPSSTVQAKTVLAAPLLNSSSPSNSSIVVTWAPVPNAVLYSVSIIRDDSYQQSRLNTSNTNVTFSNLEAGTNYCIKANAWSPLSVPGDDYTICQITRPPPPQSIVLLTTIVNNVMGLSVSWNPAQGASWYIAVSSTGLNCSSASTSCTLSPLSCGQIHYISVTAFNQAGPSQSSESQRYISFPCPPEPVHVNDIGNGNCSLSWNSVSYVDYYTAFSKRDDGIEEMCNSMGTSCNFSCHCGYSYIMSVFANNQAGASPPGRILNQTTLSCCPENLVVSAISWESLMMTWTAVRGADMYKVQAVDSSNNAVLCNDTSPVCVLSGLNCNTRYNVLVFPCNEARGCNHSCSPQTQETAPCMPDRVTVSPSNSLSINITWTSTNKVANYTVTVIGSADGPFTCQSNTTYCQVNGLSCGSSYQVTSIASTAAGLSMPSYSIFFQTAPCCPATLNVTQVTQAMSNVTWSAAQGAQFFMASLTSSRGNATCRTMQTKCLMGCITCGTNYTVSLQAINSKGNTAVCMYHGFSTSECCPSRIRLYTRFNNTLRVSWWSSSSLSNFTAQVTGGSRAHTCSPAPGESMCDVSEVTCGDVYTVMVAPMNPDRTVVPFCPSRTYSVYCSGSDVGMVLYRGKRSLD